MVRDLMPFIYEDHGYNLWILTMLTVRPNTKCVHHPGQGTIPTHHKDPSIWRQPTTSSVYKEAEDHLCGEKSERCGGFVLFHAQAHKRLAVLSWLGLVFPGLYKRGRYVKIISLSFYSKQGSWKERKKLPSSILTDPWLIFMNLIIFLLLFQFTPDHGLTTLCSGGKNEMNRTCCFSSMKIWNG